MVDCGEGRTNETPLSVDHVVGQVEAVLVLLEIDLGPVIRPGTELQRGQVIDASGWEAP